VESAYFVVTRRRKTVSARSSSARRRAIPDAHAPRVSDGARTRDILDHNQVLYQLSYTHHASGPKTVSRTMLRSVKCTGRGLARSNQFSIGATPVSAP
jgi:hypothetical protein